jgi:streptogramin lyase
MAGHANGWCGFGERWIRPTAVVALFVCAAFSLMWCGTALAAPAPEGQITEFSTGLQASNHSIPFGIAAGPDGNLWFADRGTTRAIGRITPSGQITEFSTGLQPSNGSLPVNIAAGPDGNMWFTDQGTTKEIGRITPSGQITEFSTGLQPSNGSYPVDIAAGPDGNSGSPTRARLAKSGRSPRAA